MYRNVMEIFAEQKLQSLWKDSNTCHCQHCHDDIIAYALNKLPAKYVSTTKGELFKRAEALSRDNEIQMVKALIEGMTIVEQHPRHPKKEEVNGFQFFSEED